MNETEKEQLKKEGLDARLRALFGYKIYGYLHDENVFEIIANPDGKIFLKTTRGDVQLEEILPSDKRRQIINEIAGFSNIEATEEQPLPSVEFFDMRFQGFLPPTTEYPAFNIRRHASRVFTLDEYEKNETITSKQKQLLLEAIHNKKNIIIGGATGTGKTTFLNAILAEIAKTDDRIVMIEQVPELKCLSNNKLSLKSTDTISMDRLLKATLRATPDRIVVGEIRGSEALTLLDAWSTGHRGGASTIHSNSARETLTRLDQLVARVLDKNTEYVIGDAIDVIIYINRIGLKRKVEKIIKVNAYNKLKQDYDLEELG